MTNLPFGEVAPQGYPTYKPGGTFEVESVGAVLGNTDTMHEVGRDMAERMQQILNKAAQAGGETTIIPFTLTREVAGWGTLFFVTHFPPNREASDSSEPVVTQPPAEYGEV